MIYKHEIKEIARGYLEFYKEEINRIKDEDFRENLKVFLEDLSNMKSLANDNNKQNEVLKWNV